MEEYYITLNAYQYKILTNNVMIAVCCEDAVRKAEIKGDEVKILLSRSNLEELIGSVAAEANHAKSRKKEDELDYLYEILGSELISFGIDCPYE